MNTRNLLQHGPSSLAITMPTKWVKSNNLEKNMPVFVAESGNKIIVSTQGNNSLKICKVDISSLDKISLIHAIQSRYRAGYDEIILAYNDSEIMQFPQCTKSSITSIVNYVVSRFIGLEVVEQTKNSIVLKQVSLDDEKEFYKLLRRLFHMINSLSDFFIDAVEKDDFSKLKEIKEKHDFMNNLSNYLMRIISKNKIEENQYNLYHLLAQLDKIVDVFKYVANDLAESKHHTCKDATAVYRQIVSSIRLYVDYFYNPTNEKISQLNEARWKIKKTIIKNISKLNPTDVSNITRMEGICEIILDITESRMAITLPKD